MPLTLNQAKPLAALIHQLRPEWDEPGILKALERCAGRDAFDVAMAAVRAANDKGAKTPGVIPSPDGPHWTERLSSLHSPRNPMRHEECSKHPGQYRLSCSGCHGDRKAKREEADAEERAQAVLSREEALRAARQVLEDAKSEHCIHGVPRKRCKDPHREYARADIAAAQHPTTSPETGEIEESQ